MRLFWQILFSVLPVLFLSTGGKVFAADNSPIKLIVTPIEGIAGGFDTAKLDETSGVEVRFTRGAGRYAFDVGAEPWYQTAQLLRKYYQPFGKGYIAPWKLIPAGEDDTVEADITAGKAEAEEIRFVLKDGTGVLANKSTDALPVAVLAENNESPS